ncbi:hypothetical protein M8C21_000373, partial [Ambrosia artemisiifolia]
AVVTMNNFQQYRHISPPGWTLGWTWAKKEIIWSMMGGQATEPGTPYNQPISNCCKGGVINSWAQDPNNYASSFQVSVGAAGTTNKTVKPPKNFTLLAPGPGYTCGPAIVGKRTKLITADGRRVNQAMSDGVVLRGESYGIPSIRGDGDDALAIYSVAYEARKMSIEKQTPVLIEALTYRTGHHSTSDDSTSIAWLKKLNGGELET